MAVEHGRSEFVQPLTHGLLDSYTYNIIYFEGHRSLEQNISTVIYTPDIPKKTSLMSSE